MPYLYETTDELDPDVDWPTQGGLYDRDATTGALIEVIGPPLPPEPAE